MLAAQRKSDIDPNDVEVRLELALTQCETLRQLGAIETWLGRDALDDGPDALESVGDEPFPYQGGPLEVASQNALMKSQLLCQS